MEVRIPFLIDIGKQSTEREVRFTFYDVLRNRKIENEIWNSVFPHDHMISYKKGHHQSKLSLQVNLSQQTP